MYDHTDCLYAALVLAVAFVLAAPVSIWRARRGTREGQRFHFAVWLAASALTLCWIDTGMHALALTDLHEIETFAYAPFAAAFGAVLLAVAPYGGRDGWRTLAGVGAIFGLSVLLVPVPWNAEKRAILDASAVLDQPLSAVGERMGDYHAWLHDASGAQIGEGRIAELDLAALSPAEIELTEIGGLYLTVEDGIVREAWFNYD